VAGEDQIFYPANAVIVGNQVKVWSDKVKEPTIVRYGWQPFTRANLVNGAGLPASTFRSDVQ
jgi:sialate O-acetylesterase